VGVLGVAGVLACRPRMLEDTRGGPTTGGTRSGDPSAVDTLSG